jgi:hypothetical protein
MQPAEIIRLAVEAEQSGKESLGSAATNTPRHPGSLVRQTMRWLEGRGPFPRRREASS